MSSKKFTHTIFVNIYFSDANATAAALTSPSTVSNVISQFYIAISFVVFLALTTLIVIVLVLWRRVSKVEKGMKNSKNSNSSNAHAAKFNKKTSEVALQIEAENSGPLVRQISASTSYTQPMFSNADDPDLRALEQRHELLDDDVIDLEAQRNSRLELNTDQDNVELDSLTQVKQQNFDASHDSDASSLTRRLLGVVDMRTSDELRPETPQGLLA